VSKLTLLWEFNTQYTRAPCRCCVVSLAWIIHINKWPHSASRKVFHANKTTWCRVDSFTGACLSCRGVFRLVWHVVNYVAAMLGCEITLLIYALAAVPLTCTGSACSQWRI